MQLVCDASFLVWCIGSPEGTEADRRYELQRFAWRFEPIGPAHLFFEIGNALRKAHLNIPLSRRADVHAALVDGIGFETPQGASASQFHELAAKHSITFYDASYLWMTRQDPSRILVTQDHRLRRAAAAELGEARVLDAEALATLHHDDEDARGPA